MIPEEPRIERSRIERSRIERSRIERSGKIEINVEKEEDFLFFSRFYQK